MALSNDWTLQYLNGSTWTTISNVQTLSCSVGRRAPLEEWPISSASMRVWYPNGYSSPLANFGAGTMIRFSAPGRSATKPMWTGYVKNATLELGIPWNSGTNYGASDYLSIECEGAGGLIGRADQVTLSGLLTAMPVSDVVKTLNNASLVVGYDTTDTAFTTRQWGTGLGSVSEYPWQLLQNTAVYGQWRLVDGVRKTWSWAGSAGAADYPAAYLLASPKKPATATTASFSDTANSATARSYDAVTFDGIADVFTNRCSLTYFYSLGSVYQTETATNGPAPWRTYAANVLPQTPLSLGFSTYIDETAAWYSQAFADSLPTVSSISATTYGQQTNNLDNLGVTDLEFGMLPGYVVALTLRGSSQLCQIEGATVTADTSGARYTYYVSPAGNTQWFTLDNANFGKLDENRLGVY